MNLGELRADVRSIIMEPTQGFRTDAEINRWINQANLELGTIWRVQDTFVLQTQPGLSTYTLPVADGLWLDAHEMATGKRIPILNFDALDPNNTYAEMTMVIWGATATIVPAVTRQTQIACFYERPCKPLLVDADVPEFPEAFHRYCAQFGAAMAFAKDEDLQGYSTHFQQYQIGLQQLGQYKAMYDKQRVASPPVYQVSLNASQWGGGLDAESSADIQ